MYDILTYWNESPKFPWSSLCDFMDNVKKHEPKRNIIVLTEREGITGMKTERPLYPGWKGWWGKINLFTRHNPTLFIDLDTRITKPLPKSFDEIQKDVVMLDDDRMPGVRGSGVLWIAPNTDLAKEIVDKMRGFGEEIQKAYTLLPHHFGDQGYIWQTAIRMGRKEQVGIWQEMYPNEFYCATPDTRTGCRAYNGETFVYLSGEPTLGRLNHPGAPWNK